MKKEKVQLNFKIGGLKEEIERYNKLLEISQKLEEIEKRKYVVHGSEIGILKNELKSLADEYSNYAAMTEKVTPIIVKGTSDIEDSLTKSSEQMGKGLFNLSNTLPVELGNIVKGSKDLIGGFFNEFSYMSMEGVKKRILALKDHATTLNEQVLKDIQLSNSKIEEFQSKNRLHDIQDAINEYEVKHGLDWKYTEDGKDLYASLFATKKALYKDDQDTYMKIALEANLYEYELQKRASKYSNQIQEETAEQKRQRDQKLFEEERANRIEAGKQFGNIEVQNADEILEAKTSATLELKGADDILAQNNKKLAESEKENQKNRLDQWKDYAQKAAEISQKISEATSMVTNSLGGMFGQLGSYYAEQVQAFADKIAVLDEEKEAALERVALSEEERQEKENEIALQRIELEYATSEEQRTKADERIATLQGELSAEDTINREFGDKKAELEKEKAKKEAEQKKAEKMEKRLQMSQSIVEAIGNVAAGAAKGLSYGPILGPIMAAIVTAAGAVQVGIMTKQLTKMKDGGLLHGFSHSQGGMRIMGSNVEVEGGEYVVNKQSTRKNLGLLEYINGERRGLGYSDMNTFFGQNSTTPSFLTQMMNEPSVVPQLPMRDSVDTQILNAIERINFQPRVSVTDINTVHESMVKVDEWTGM